MSPDTAELKRELENTVEKSNWDDSFNRGEETQDKETNPKPSSEETEREQQEPTEASKMESEEATDANQNEEAEIAEGMTATPRKVNRKTAVPPSDRTLRRRPSRDEDPSNNPPLSSIINPYSKNEKKNERDTT
jgi:hypothetical protein